MLKIKDDVDLKELEKFGFKKQPRHYGGYYRCISTGVEIIIILSDKSDLPRKIMIDEWYENDPRVHKHPNCKYRSNITVIDVLYDLIKAGLIEKVSDKKCH